MAWPAIHKLFDFLPPLPHWLTTTAEEREQNKWERAAKHKAYVVRWLTWTKFRTGKIPHLPSKNEGKIPHQVEIRNFPCGKIPPRNPPPPPVCVLYTPCRRWGIGVPHTKRQYAAFAHHAHQTFSCVGIAGCAAGCAAAEQPLASRIGTPSPKGHAFHGGSMLLGSACCSCWVEPYWCPSVWLTVDHSATHIV